MSNHTTVKRSKYYVYSHSCDGLIFYVGMGINGRAFDSTYRSKKWIDYVNSLPNMEYQINIIEYFEGRKESVEFEKQKIKEIKPIVNIRGIKEQHIKIKQKAGLGRCVAGTVVYPVRLSPETFERIKKIAKENKTDNGKVIRALIEKSL